MSRVPDEVVIMAILWSGMMGRIQCAQALLDHVRIDLGGGNIGVAKHLLQCAQICATRQQMASEGMAKAVRRDRRAIETGGGRQPLEFEREMLPGEMPEAPVRRKQPLALSIHPCA